MLQISFSRQLPAALLVVVSLVTAAEAGVLTLQVLDAQTGAPLPARVYLQANSGEWHFLQAPEAQTYSKINWINARSEEHHTCLLAGQGTAELPPGKYQLTVERGPEYLPATQHVEMTTAAAAVVVRLQRICHLPQRGWYSGETHIHRSIEELRTIALAEDLHVTFPLTFWETRAGEPALQGNKNIPGTPPDELIALDDTHVIWPRNTEYEIFTVGPRTHTLGALFLLNHRQIFSRGVPPWGPVMEQARAEGALFDLDKLDWPFAMTLPVLTPGGLYELSNNHLWRTEFAFRNWNSPAPAYLQPHFGGQQGNERDWLLYTLGMYYTLLNAGLDLVPTAGTAHGVHPVPAGFARVYVQLDGPFHYERWLQGLQQGRSFVTTGPLVLATLDQHSPSKEPIRYPASPATAQLQAEIFSAAPVSFCEVIAQGLPVATYIGRSQPQPEGGYRMELNVPVPVTQSGWLALRVWEDRPGQRFRFAHTAPWFVQLPGSELRARPEERDYLVGRMQAEIARSQHVLTEEALAEYRQALDYYQQLPVAPPTDRSQLRSTGNEQALATWLENMLRYHRFTPAEVELVTGLNPQQQAAAVQRLQVPVDQPAEFSAERLTVLPYPGGRHPRTGFLDGAQQPQRDSKVSVFLPWERPQFDPSGSRGYVVVDVPEAIFTNLGLTYLAHTHVPTLWDQQQIQLPQLEWQATQTGWELQRVLPNGIRFTATVTPQRDFVDLQLQLHNGTSAPLTGMRVQNCVMLRGAPGFHDQTNSNKLFEAPFVAVHDESKSHWIITAWTPNHRAWGNPPVPCLHSDPVFPDCAPGATVEARGRLWFYHGTDIHAFLESARQAGW
jgi:hypothetical protein